MPELFAEFKSILSKPIPTRDIAFNFFVFLNTFSFKGSRPAIRPSTLSKKLIISSSVNLRLYDLILPYNLFL